MIKIDFILCIIFLGICMAILQIVMTKDKLRIFDRFLPKGIIWFGKDSWKNKYDWFIIIKTKRYYTFKYYPFIIITDIFHLSHGIFGILIGCLCAFSIENDLYKFLMIITTSFLYSNSFGLLYKKFSKLK